MTEIHIPITSIGVGSQPLEEGDATLEFIPMPSEMTVFEVSSLPEPEDVANLVDGMNALRLVRDALLKYNMNDDLTMIDITDLDDQNRHWVDQMLGHGEVSVIYQGGVRTDIQESVFAGVWRIQYVDAAGALVKDFIEISAIPEVVKNSSFLQAKTVLEYDQDKLPPGVMNATALVTELNDKIVTWKEGDEPHVINFSLLPQTEQDLEFLDELLGTGPVLILSRGYGNCRISSTTTRNVWWVKYFNSEDKMILNTVEISAIPDVACAAQEDIADSAERFVEVMEMYDE
ncbi:MAG: hydrogenase expression/formation C-terminal domain-containing protein [Mariprofundus sp.]|nr:hydrogenase expression/formation C-terminal domain-containing protein [Mariprofundus sp.]